MKVSSLTLLSMLACSACTPGAIKRHEPPVQPPNDPIIVSQIPNLNDYSLFANNGWDGNWYVGYNNGWVKKLPAIQKGKYARAFIGAKLGRMKTLPPVGRPPEFNPVPGEIWAALSSTPSWTSDQRVKLTSTNDIPLDGSAEYALENVGESQWFWAEVPVRSVSFSSENYLVLWSPTPELVSISSSPVLAGAWGGHDVDTWVVKDIRGAPPGNPDAALKTPISVLQPALALKLIPEGSPHPMRLRMLSWQNGTPEHPKPVLSGFAEGDAIERVWVEYKDPHKHGDVVSGRWIQAGRSLWKAPYTFSLDPSKLPHGKILLRLSAVNIWEESSSSDAFEREVNPIHETK